MDLAIQVGALLVWLPLNVLIITALLRGGYRRFPFVFVYIVIELLTTAAELAVQTRSARGVSLLVRVFWVDEAIAQLLVFTIVLSFIHRATADIRSRRMVRTALVAGALVFAAGSFAVHYRSGQTLGLWMTAWNRDLNFCAAILDLLLWAVLIASRQRDRKLLLLSGALGIQFTGEAIGESVRDLAILHRSHSISLVGSTIMVTANIVRSYVWWQVFRTADVKKRAAAQARLQNSNTSID